MKKLLTLTVLLAVIAGFVYGQTTVTNRGEVIEVNTMEDMAESTETNNVEEVYALDVGEDLNVGGDANVGGSPVVTQATSVQADTNATTTATDYTPAYAGQVLLGGAGTGTNGVWVSKGTTTNDWVQVAP